MFFVAIPSIVIAILAGLIIKFALDYSRSTKEITWIEFGLGTAAIVLFIVPLVTYFGWQVAKSNNLLFHEYYNGWEQEAQASTTICTKDGGCWYHYDCEPYIVMEACGETCSGSGSSQTCTTNYCPVTHYHDCPYVIQETDYIVKTTLGDYTISEHRLPDNPDQNRWRGTSDYESSIPGYVKQKAGIGAPQFWIDAKARLDANRPGPVTKRFDYDNYILASDQTILNQYSADIETYKKSNLLPKIESSVGNFYHARKVYYVGLNPPTNDYNWQTQLEYLNAALGSEFQGDLHLVVANSSAVTNPDSYIFALKAYWQDKKLFERETASKNTIIVVIGTEDEKTVAWSRATTGMPMGNEAMLVALRNNLKGVSLTPDAVIGGLYGQLTNSKQITSVHSSGSLEKIVFGLENPSTRFKRLSMSGKNGGTGFLYLSDEIQLSGGQKFAIGFFSLFLSLIVWGVTVGVGDRAYGEHRSSLTLQQLTDDINAAMMRWRSKLSLTIKQTRRRLMRNGQKGAVSSKMLIVLVVGIVLALLAGGTVLSLYNYANGLRSEGIQKETTLNAQYLDNQNELSTYVSSFYEQIGVANLKSDKMTQFVTDAVKGKFQDQNGRTDTGRGGSFFSALVEAYPAADKQFEIYDKIVSFIQSGREAYKNKQSKLLDLLRNYDNWRRDGALQSRIIGRLGFPSDALEARIGTQVTHGVAARDQMYLIVTTSSTKQAYQSGTMEPLTVPK